MLRGITADLLEASGVAWHHGGFIGGSWCYVASRRIYWRLVVLRGITADLLEARGVEWHHGGFIGDSWYCMASRRIYVDGITALLASRRIYADGITAPTVLCHHGGYNL